MILSAFVIGLSVHTAVRSADFSQIGETFT